MGEIDELLKRRPHLLPCCPRISHGKMFTPFQRALRVSTAVTQIWAMLRAPSGPDTERMAARYGIAVVGDPASDHADGHAWPGAPRFAPAKFQRSRGS
jgi:hypothetical protein